VKSKVLIVDYGLGNLHSVAKSFQYLGCSVEVSADASALGHAERVVLPGVGAFADGMAGLRARGQDEALFA
jgi:glutamine amidotransferase